VVDSELTQLLINLAEAIRKVPEGREHQALVNRFFALLRHLEAKGTISSDSWNLSSRR
jgi:hypothetical protein